MVALGVLEANRDAIEALCKKYAVVRLRLFGSALRRDWDPGSSDFDFLAEFGEAPAGMNGFKQFFRFATELEELLGRHVDVVDWKAAEKPLFKKAAEAEAREWYAA